MNESCELKHDSGMHTSTQPGELKVVFDLLTIATTEISYAEPLKNDNVARNCFNRQRQTRRLQHDLAIEKYRRSRNWLARQVMLYIRKPSRNIVSHRIYHLSAKALRQDYPIR